MMTFVLVGRRLHMVEIDRNTACGLAYDLTAFQTSNPRKEDVCLACRRYVSDDFWGPISSYVE